MDSILKRILENKELGNGSIVLMHDGEKYTVEALEHIITDHIFFYFAKL